jgi:hypothetical protein
MDTSVLSSRGVQIKQEDGSLVVVRECGIMQWTCATITHINLDGAPI